MTLEPDILPNVELDRVKWSNLFERMDLGTENGRFPDGSSGGT
jgi:hypothetical protein